MRKRILSILMTVIMLAGGIISAEAAEVNLMQLQGVTGYMKSTKGDYELPVSGANIITNAWDGDEGTFACAGNEWTWALEADLGDNYNVASVALTFSTLGFPTQYKVSLSINGSVWEDKVIIEDNTSHERRVHKFSPATARYIKVTDLKENPGTQMLIAELEAYESSEDEIVMSLAQPADGEIGVSRDTKVIIATGETIPMSYMSGMKLMHGYEETDSYKRFEDGNVIITPKNKLVAGKYDITVQGRKMWSFTVANDNLTKTATAKKISMSEVEVVTNYSGTFYPASYAIDGNVNTSMSIDEDWKRFYLQLDFGKPYENMNLARITFANADGLGNTEILVSDDAVTWKEAAVFPANKQNQIDVYFPPVTARYMRLAIRSSNHSKTTFAEVDILSIPGEEEAEAEIIPCDNANGNIVINFSDGIDMNTVPEGITLKKGDASTPCKDRETVEFDFIAENSKKIILTPKSGLDYNSSYIINVKDTLKSVWGIPAAPKFKEFTVGEEKPLEITTLSSSEYFSDKENSIYPAFVDNMPYQSWTEDGERNYYDIKAAGGKAPYKFSISKGALPGGITMDENGRLSGTPTAEGNFEFTVKVTDFSGVAAEKTLVMESNPYRSKWYADARFGIMNQSMNAINQIKQYGPVEGMALFEEYVDEVFYPEKWAKQLSNMGAKVFNFTAMGGDGVRKWPSKMPGTYGFAMKRNCVQELLDACHKYDIKLMTYIAPDTTWSGSIELDPTTGGWYPIMKEAARELAQMKVDAIWCDMGMQQTEADWAELAAIVRTENPYTVFFTNNGILHGGKVTNYPYTDMQGWEGNENFNCPAEARTEGDVYTAFKTPVRKKMGLEATVLAGPHWGNEKGHGVADFTLKPVDEFTECIQSNWDAGATFMAVYPFNPQPGGDLVDPSTEGLDEISEWVKANIIPSNTPVASLEEGMYEGEQSLTLSGNGSIYYTMDGSIPDKNSIPYTEPVKITDSVRIRAVAFEEGKGKSLIMQKDYIIEGKINDCVTMVQSEVAAEVKMPIVNTMSGMQIFVGKNPVELRAIGRYATGNDGAGHIIKVQKVGNLLEGPIVETEIDMSRTEADSQGYKYKEIAPVILQPFTTYVIMCEETTESCFANVKNLSDIVTEGVTILEGVISDDMMMTRTDIEMNGDISDKTQLLNLKFNMLPVPENIDERNIASAARLKLLDNNGKECIPSAWKHFATNAIDNNTDTLAAASYAYAWTLHVDLKKTYEEINEIIVNMRGGYATVYQIDVSDDNVNWTTLTYVDDNQSDGEKVHTYEPFSARYIRIRSLKPDGANQEGGQMNVAELVIHQTDEGFAKN